MPLNPKPQIHKYMARVQADSDMCVPTSLAYHGFLCSSLALSSIEFRVHRWPSQLSFGHSRADSCLRTIHVHKLRTTTYFDVQSHMVFAGCANQNVSNVDGEKPNLGQIHLWKISSSAQHQLSSDVVAGGYNDITY